MPSLCPYPLTGPGQGSDGSGAPSACDLGLALIRTASQKAQGVVEFRWFREQQRGRQVRWNLRWCKDWTDSAVAEGGQIKMKGRKEEQVSWLRG